MIAWVLAIGLAAVGARGAVDPCRLYGDVYFTTWKSDADVKVRIVTSFADLLIQNTTSSLSDPGRWREVSSKVSADYVVYVTTWQSEADVDIAWTTSSSSRGVRSSSSFYPCEASCGGCGECSAVARAQCGSNGYPTGATAACAECACEDVRTCTNGGQWNADKCA